jgi:iron complex outermembrane receptor protein
MEGDPMRIAAAVFALSLAAPPAFAQAPEQAAVDEIVVLGQAQRNLGFNDPSSTASRLDVPLFDLPASVDRIDQDEMIARGRSSVVDALNGTTGLVGQNRAGAAGVFSWRGFTENAVATLFDGVRVQNSTVTTRNYDAFTLEAIEVSRGPMSSLFGEGALAGAVNYVRKRPFQGDGASFELLAEAGSFDSWRLGAGVNAPVTDALALRLDAVRSVQGAQVRSDETTTTQVLAGAQLRWASNLTSTLQVDWFDQSREDAYWGTPLIDGRIPFELREVNYNNATNNLYEDEVLWVTLNTEWAASDSLTLHHIVYAYDAQRDWRNIGRFLWNPGTQTVGRTFWEDLGYDHQLAGSRLFGRFGGDRYQMLFGVDGSRTDFSSPRQYSAPFGLQQQVDRFNPAQVDFFAFGRTRVPARETDVDQVGAFAEARFDVTERLAVQGAVRVDQVEADFVRFDATPTARYSASYEPVSWNVGAVWRATPALNVYAQYGRSSTPVDSLLVIGSAGDAAFDLTTGEGLEAGLKANWMDGRLQATVAYFDLSQQDIPSTDPNNPARAIQIGEVESRGLEGSLILNAIETVTVEANLAVVEAEYARFVEFGAVRTGNTPPNVPEVVANLFADWRFAPTWSAGFAVRAVDGVFANTSNTIRFPGYTLLDADLRWRIRPGVDLSVIGRNLGDEDYAAWATGAGGQNAMANIGPGRSVLATLRLRY